MPHGIGSAPEPAVGVHAVRTFRISANGRLMPLVQVSDEWSAGWCIARCGREHQAPALDCTCGIYSLNNWRELRVQYPVASTRVIAVVALEGITIEGRKGYRSQAARVVDIWLRPGRLALPVDVVARLRENYPGVRFHTDLTEMLAAYPELPNSARPRRELLARAAREWRMTVRRPESGWVLPVALGTLATGVAVGLGYAVTVPDRPDLGGQVALLASLALAWIAFVLASAELVLQAATIAIVGVSQPLLFAPRRPVLAAGRIGLITALAGAAAMGLRGSPEALWPAIGLVAAWIALMAAELFMTILAPGRQPVPWRTFAAGTRQPVEHRRIGSTMRRPRRGVWPIVIAPPPTEGE